MKTGHLLFSHGSLLCGSEQTILRHCRELEAATNWERVRPGFMNYSEPTFEAAVAEFAADGFEKIIIAPYFLVPGKFVRVDLPQRVEAAVKAYPHLVFEVAKPLGADLRLVIAIGNHAYKSLPSSAWRRPLEEIRAHCRNRTDCPLYDPSICPMIIPDGQFSKSQTNSSEYLKIDPRKTALLVMVHGSPRETANKPMFEVIDLIQQKSMFRHVEAGFMECNSPDIPTAISRCVESGADTIIAVPYFLHVGNHVAEDLPTLLEEASLKYPRIRFGMSNYLGSSDEVTALIAQRAEEAI